jgi:hypothetical protein
VRLKLEFPAHWKEEQIAGVRVVTVASKHAPNLFFEVHPMVPRRELDVDALLARGVSPAARLARSAPVVQSTRTGWPMTLFEVEIQEAQVSEIRILVRYEILTLAAAVLVRATSRERLERRRSDVVTFLATAQPDLTTDAPARIGELWDMGAGTP